MAQTLSEYLATTAANDAEVYRRLAAYAAVARKSHLMLKVTALDPTSDQMVFTHLIYRASDLGFNMAVKQSRVYHAR